ncbi:MAG: hypothetical protein MK078_06970 [Crocinitomicaceae bacterium]|nr:hypothetical protein [Crocinitomicaceae bacterium]
MEQFNIKPLSGVNQLKFGKTRDEIIEDFEDPTEEEGRTDYYEFESFSLALSYDRNDKLEFIEFSKVSEGTPVLLHEIDVFNLEGEALLKEIENISSDSFNQENSEPPYTYIFDSLEIAIDRPTTPEEYEEGEAESSDGYENGKYFRSIGIGCKGYFSSTDLVD